MIRTSEVVLPGHPDKFCDLAADAIVAACYRADPRAYCQVEMSVWCQRVVLTGGIVTRAPLDRPLADIVRGVGRGIGYVEPNPVVADEYVVDDAVCQSREDPRRWTDHVNDQCIAVGWAGYDARVNWLPPEHFMAHEFGAALRESCRSGRLRGQGPDGKLLVRLRENSDSWRVEHLLVTIQQRAETAFLDFCGLVAADLRDAYGRLRARDPRWSARFEDIDVLVNPNGPLLNGGSHGDNGQTGRKLVMDYYGPRVPIGGGALSGKDLCHIDRAAAYAARHAALHAVHAGACECRVTLAYAPNRDVPLDVSYEVEHRGPRCPPTWFAHSALRERYSSGSFAPDLGAGRHFADLQLPWNRPAA
jgi:S-adenosylmethionine synthetase